MNPGGEDCSGPAWVTDRSRLPLKKKSQTNIPQKVCNGKDVSNQRQQPELSHRLVKMQIDTNNLENGVVESAKAEYTRIMEHDNCTRRQVPHRDAHTCSAKSRHRNSYTNIIDNSLQIGNSQCLPKIDK